MNCVHGYNKSLNFLLSNYLLSYRKNSWNISTYTCIIFHWLAKQQKSLLPIETGLLIDYNIKAITNRNKRLWQTAFDLSADLRSKICIRPSYAEGVPNYGGNRAQLQVHIFPVFPACLYTKTRFFWHFLVNNAHSCITCTHYTWKIMVMGFFHFTRCVCDVWPTALHLST